MISDKKILVVEDDELLRKIIIDQLTSLGYLVLPAADGEEAIQQAEKNKPGIIVLDLLLPKLDGFGVLKKLRSSADPELAKTAVLVVSNLSDSNSIQWAKDYGVLEYYIKSDIELGILGNRIERYFTQGT
jgi:DNA-binding response OmpR family regulator